MMKREQDYAGAQALLANILDRGSGVQAPIRHLRAIAAAAGGDLETARADADFLRFSIKNYSTHDIEARIGKLARGDYDGAERELDGRLVTKTCGTSFCARASSTPRRATWPLRLPTANSRGRGPQRSERRTGCSTSTKWSFDPAAAR